MGWYTCHVFPRLLDWLMRQRPVARERPKAVGRACGRVLEIGFGTGLNLPHYGHGVTQLVALEPVSMLPKRVARRVAEAPIPVERVMGRAEELPFAEGFFDSVVSTFTLCTVGDARQSLAEIARVLRPGGQFVFLEHGQSDNPRVARWQDRLNNLQRWLACGCNLNRPIDELVRASGLSLDELERYRLPRAPRIVGELYLGTAKKS
jgi:ubiquinone/menaquinone biosynthesis C-methylase UbiE